MATNQPIWEFVANLGDVNIADYGGFIVYRDTTGVYPPEVEIYEASDDETGGTVYRFVLEPPRFKTCSHQPGPCKGYPNGCLEPVWHREWFAEKDNLESAASTAGMSPFSLLRLLASKDPIKRAQGYQVLIGNFGPDEFDSYPRTLTESEAQERYSEVSKLSRQQVYGGGQ